MVLHDGRPPTELKSPHRVFNMPVLDSDSLVPAILERRPVEYDPPDRSTLSRWLKRATQQGLICCSGSGYRGDCFRYWLPGHEPLLWPGYNASEE